MSESNQSENVEKRLQYFDGQFLVVDDFEDEQKYHLDRQRRQNRLLRTPGILEGLNVTVVPDSTIVEISPGTAVDFAGKLIVLGDTQTLDLADYKATKVTLTIAYAEISSNPATSGAGSGRNTRWHEQPVFEIIREGETGKHNYALTIANASIGSDSKVTFTANYASNLAGIKFAGTEFNGSEVSLRPTSTNELTLNGSLTVSGALSAQALDVRGLRLNGSANISGNAVIRGTLTFSGTNSRQLLSFDDSKYGIGVQPNTQYFRSDRNFAWYKSGIHDATELSPGGSGDRAGTLQMLLDSEGRMGIGESNPRFKLDVAGSIRGSSLDIDGNIRGNSLDIDGSIRGNCIGSHFVLPSPLKWFFKAQGERWTTVLRYDLSLEAECDVVVIANAHGKAPADRDAGITSTTAGSINCEISFGRDRLAPFNQTLSYGMGFAFNSSGAVWVPIQAIASKRLLKGNHTINFRFCSSRTGNPPQDNSAQVHGPAMLILLMGVRKN